MSPNEHKVRIQAKMTTGICVRGSVIMAIMLKKSKNKVIKIAKNKSKRLVFMVSPKFKDLRLGRVRVLDEVGL